MNQDILSSTISKIYDASLQPSLWEQALAEILQCVGRKHGCLQYLDFKTDTGGVLASHGYDSSLYDDPEIIGTYMSHDLWAKELLKKRSFEYILGSSLVPEKVMNNSFLANELLDGYGLPLSDVLGATDCRDETMHSLLCIYRGPKDDKFSYEERKRLQLLWPHVKKAVEVHKRITTQISGEPFVGNPENEQEMGVIGIDQNYQITFANSQAERLFEVEGAIRRIRNRLVAIQHAENFVLQSSLKEALHPEGAVTRGAVKLHATVPEDRLRWTITIVPTKNQVEYLHHLGPEQKYPSALILINDHNPEIRFKVHSIALKYRLTLAEEALLDNMLQTTAGLSTLAEKSGKSVETLRTQLKSIYQKTGTDSRLALTMLVMLSPGP